MIIKNFKNRLSLGFLLRVRQKRPFQLAWIEKKIPREKSFYLATLGTLNTKAMLFFFFGKLRFLNREKDVGQKNGERGGEGARVPRSYPEMLHVLNHISSKPLPV